MDIYTRGGVSNGSNYILTTFGFVTNRYAPNIATRFFAFYYDPNNPNSSFNVLQQNQKLNGWFDGLGNTMSNLNLGANVNFTNNAPTILTFSANTNTYAEINVQNFNSGGSASGDVTVTANNGSANQFYGNFGINSSGFTNTAALPSGTNTVYLIAQGNAGNTNGGTTVNLFVGAAQTNAAIQWSAGNGLTTTNMQLTASGLTLNVGQFSGNGAGVTNLNFVGLLNAGTNGYFTYSTNAANGILTATLIPTNFPASIPSGLVTNYSGAPISVTNAGGTATTITSNSITITNGIFKTTLGTGLTLNGGVLTLGQTNGNSKLWSIYTTNNNMYIDGAVGGSGQNLYFGTSANTISALNFANVGSFQSCPSITVSTYIGTDGGNDYWSKQTISTLDPLTIFGLGGNSHNSFQFPNAFGSTVITNGSPTSPCVTVCGQTGGTGDLMQWWDGGNKRASVSTNGVYSAVGFSSTGTHTPVAVTVGASPFNFTNNTGSALECYFSGATAYTIGKNGVTVFASMIANDYLILQASSYATITYTVAPTFYTNAW
jgi:hypothetical protein